MPPAVSSYFILHPRPSSSLSPPAPTRLTNEGAAATDTGTARDGGSIAAQERTGPFGAYEPSDEEIREMIPIPRDPMCFEKQRHLA